MTSREYKYLKGDKWMSFFSGEPFKVSAKHWFMRRRLSRMTTDQYIRWKQQQCIQQDLNDLINPPKTKNTNSSYFLPFQGDLVGFGFEKQNQAPDQERSVAENPQ